MNVKTRWRRIILHTGPTEFGDLLYMTRSEINVPSQNLFVPKITMQTKSHNLNLNLNVLSSVVDSSGDEV